jgi:hypothetical protein
MNGSAPSPDPPQSYLAFDGAASFVEIANSPVLSLATTGALTVSAWMMPATLTFANAVNGYVYWLGKGTGSGRSGQQEWAFRMYNLENDAGRRNRISFYVFNPDGHLGVGSYFESPDDPVIAGTWMHFCGVADNGTITLYKNGADTGHCFQYQGDGPCRQQFDSDGNRVLITPVATAAPLRIGTEDGKSLFQGGIAKVRLWSRALDDAEIADLYGNDTVPADRLVAEYRLDEGGGDIAHDTSGGNDGTIIGASWGP